MLTEQQAAMNECEEALGAAILKKKDVAAVPINALILVLNAMPQDGNPLPRKTITDVIDSLQDGPFKENEDYPNGWFVLDEAAASVALHLNELRDWMADPNEMKDWQEEADDFLEALGILPDKEKTNG